MTFQQTELRNDLSENQLWGILLVVGILVAVVGIITVPYDYGITIIIGIVIVGLAFVLRARLKKKASKA